MMMALFILFGCGWLVGFLEGRGSQEVQEAR
jgi:hypothetical protein